MVDGPGSDLAPKKIWVLDGNFFILTQKQIDDRLKLHVENTEESNEKRNIVLLRGRSGLRGDDLSKLKKEDDEQLSGTGEI